VNKDIKLIFEAYKSVNEQQEWTNMEDWVKYFSQPSISNAPVSYKTQMAGSEGTSYGGNVTVNDIIKRAKNSLSVMGSNPQDKQRILTQAANSLQDYISGSKQLDNQTISDLMDEFAKLDNVERFVNAYTVTSTPVPQIAQTKTFPSRQFKPVRDEEGALGKSPLISSYSNISEEDLTVDMYNRFKKESDADFVIKLSQIQNSLIDARKEIPGFDTIMAANIPGYAGMINTLNSLSKLTTFTDSQKAQLALIAAKMLKAKQLNNNK
jgi:hypothetical protein